MSGTSAPVTRLAADGAAVERRSDLTTLARGGALNLVGTIANAVLNFAFGLVITRGLHARGAGLFFEAVAVFTVATTVTQFGAEVGVVRNIPRYRALGRDADARACLPVALLPVLCGSSLAAALLFALAPEISHLVVRGADRNALVPYLHVLAPFLPLAAASKVLLAATRGYGTMVPFIATEYLGKAGLRPLLALAAVAGGSGAIGMALSWSIPIALGFVAAIVWLVVLVRRAQSRPGVEPERRQPLAALARDFWRFTIFRGVSAVFDVGVLWIGVLLVGALGSARQAGIYAAASRLLSVGAFALQAVFLVIGPQISALLAQRSRERALGIYQISTAWLTAIAFPVYLTMAVFAPLLLRIFGADFTAGATALRILALAGLVNMATGAVTVVLLMGGKSSWNLANNATALVVNVGLDVVLIPRFGLDGAAIAWAASILVQNLAPLVQVWRALKLHPFGRGYPVVSIGAAVCFGGFGGAVVAAVGTSPTAFSVVALVATASYASLLYAFRDVLALHELRAAIRLRRARASAGVPRPAVAVAAEAARGHGR